MRRWRLPFLPMSYCLGFINFAVWAVGVVTYRRRALRQQHGSVSELDPGSLASALFLVARCGLFIRARLVRCIFSLQASGEARSRGMTSSGCGIVGRGTWTSAGRAIVFDRRRPRMRRRGTRSPLLFSIRRGAPQSARPPAGIEAAIFRLFCSSLSCTVLPPASPRADKAAPVQRDRGYSEWHAACGLAFASKI